MNDDAERGAWRRFADYLSQTRRDKREWRQYRSRLEALPKDYRMVLEKIQKFLWVAGGAVDEQSCRVLYDICDLFEEAAAARRPVLAVTGPDVAGFALNMLAATQAKTWHGQKADQLNADVHRLLDGDDGR